MDCKTRIKQVKYEEFSETIHKQAIEERIPINGVIELTFRCNLNCLHCYLPAKFSSKELTTKQIYRVIDKIVEAGCIWLLFTGGEPLIREDFLDIYTYAKSKGLIIILFTNGTLITTKIADYLKEYPPFYAEISLYGATQKTYESITGIPSSFKRCLEGINLLLEHKIPLRLKTMVLTINKHEIGQMEDFAKGLGLDFRIDPAINPRFDGSKIPCQFRVAPTDVVRFDIENKNRLRMWLKTLKEYEYYPEQFDYIFNCPIGKSSFHIDPYGLMMPCMMVRDSKYDLVSGSFKQGWSLFEEIIKQKPRPDYKCRSCPIYIFCDRCPGWSMLEKKDAQGTVGYLCKIAHQRAEAFKDYFIKKGGAGLCRKKDLKNLMKNLY